MVVGRPASFSWKPGSSLRFHVKSGDIPTLEIKFIDKDGTVWGARKTDISGDSDVSLSFRDTEYFWGGDSNIGEVNRFEFGVSGRPATGEAILTGFEVSGE